MSSVNKDIREAAIMNLLKEHGTSFVSIYLPTYTGRETGQNMVRFRHLLATAKAKLIERGVHASDATVLLADATELLGEPSFWRSLDKGLAVLVSEAGTHVYQLPFACEELCSVGRRFHIVPLVAWLHQEASYYLLTLSENRAQLFRGTRQSLEAMTVPSLPKSKAVALNYDKREGSYQVHSGEPRMHTKEGLVFTGQGGESDVADQELNTFCRTVNNAVDVALKRRIEPLIVACVDHLFSIYRRHNTYPYLLETSIPGNADYTSLDDLRERAWLLANAGNRESETNAVERYWDNEHHGRCLHRLEQILPAASGGEVSSLLIDMKSHGTGVFNAETGVVELGDSLGAEDLVNLAVCLVLKHGGTVEPIASGNVPGGGMLAAILRYSADVVA